MSMVRAPARPYAAASKPSRYAYADTLKVLLVAGVIVGHVTMAYAENDAWVLDEPPVREPLETLLNLAALVGVLFAMALFFLVAGAFTPRSLNRKGARRFLIDRTVRLGVPLIIVLLALAPLVEYADSDAAGWDKGFPAFAVHTWRTWAPGHAWFLEVLLIFSVGYVVVRALVPKAAAPAPLRARYLVAAGVFIAVTSYAIRIAVPLGEEIPHLFLAHDLFVGQAPAWATGFTLGVVGARREWFDHMSRTMSHRLFLVAWTATAGVVAVVAVDVGALGTDIDAFFGGGTWQSLALAILEGALVVSMSLWVFDAFRRHVHSQGRLLRTMSRAAFAAYIIHQVVAVGAVLATRQLAWPPELEYLTAATLAVAASFGIGALLVHTPGIARIV